jgi:hypothetical protein
MRELSMSTLLITEQRDGTLVACRKSWSPARLFTRLRTRALDAALANGASPDSSAALSLRAHRLISQRARHQLSREIHKIQHEARRPPHRLTAGVPICRTKITQAGLALEALADHLLSPGPVDASGVARVQPLLRDGSSPIYRRPEADDLEDALQEAIEALELRL